MKKSVLAGLASGAWISASEFVRNELAFKSSWIEKFNFNGMTFPSDPMNNALWGLWSLMLAGTIVFLLKRMRFIEAVLVAWFMAFAMMWIVIGNLNVLPFSLLPFAIPWSLVEVTIAAWLAKKVLGI
jgi:hypothetical protein